jgi:hypothetical protein
MVMEPYVPTESLCARPRLAAFDQEGLQGHKDDDWRITPNLLCDAITRLSFLEMLFHWLTQFGNAPSIYGHATVEARRS